MSFQEKIAKAKEAGYSDQEINQYIQTKTQKAKEAGYSDEEINAFLGIASTPQPAQEPSFMEKAKQVISDPKMQAAAGMMYPPLGAGQARGLIDKGLDAAGEKAATGLAEKGVNPNVAAGIGTGIQMVDDVAEAAAGFGGAKAAEQVLKEGVKTAGPFTGALSNPAQATQAAHKATNEALGVAKRAFKSDLAKDAESVLRQKIDSPSGLRKLAEEAIEDTEKGLQKVAAGKLLYYKDALGKMWHKGGVAADSYAQALKQVETEIARRSAKVANLTEASAKGYLMGLGKEEAIPWGTTMLGAISGNPALPAMRLGATATGRRVIGRGVNAAIQGTTGVTPALAKAYDEFMKRRTKRK